jgi:hypothetical protein
VTIEIPTRDEWEADATGCEECVNPLSPHTAKLCWKHKIQYMQLSSASGVGSRSHTHRVTEEKLRRPDLNNSWEKGFARDERGVRILTSSGRPIRNKEYSTNRHHIDGELRRMKQST